MRCFQHCLEKKDHEVLMRTQSDVTLSCSAFVQGSWQNKLKIFLTVGTVDLLQIFYLQAEHHPDIPEVLKQIKTNSRS